jgi:hypothetical protein
MHSANHCSGCAFTSQLRRIEVFLSQQSARRSKQTAALLIAGIAVATQGCSKHDGLERAPINGVVTINGQPLADATIVFLPLGGSAAQGLGAVGASDAEGKFQVTSSREDDPGIPPGEYAVVVNRWAEPDGKVIPPNAFQADYPEARETIPPPYSTHSSPLRATISKEGGDVKVEIPAKLRDPKKVRG